MNNLFHSFINVSKASLISLAVFTSTQSLAVHDVQLTINTTQPLGQINKNVYGQFMEHLGRGIYEGIWVGKDSKIDNVNGFRTDVLAALKALKVPVVRWPGGCFADEYHWRDGIGKVSERPARVNTNWGGVIEPNTFGTHEFFELAEMLGADTYVNGNLGTGSVQEMAEWMEYMTSDTDSSLGKLRRENGREKPFKVDYFAVGNEAWGCGGHMRPEYYADLYRQYTSFVKASGGVKTKFIASGGQGELTEWTEVLSKNIPRKIDAIAHHYYTLPTANWGKKGMPFDFPESEWFSTIVNTRKVEKYLTDNLAILEKNDPENKIAFYLDEWGTWYDVTEGDNPGFLYQQNTLRDAVVAAENFHIFHQYPKRIQMTNIAQMINVLQAMILTDKEKMLLTPTYHVYKMYIPFQQAESLPVNVEQASFYSIGEQSINAITASAAIGVDGKTYISLVNVDPTEKAEVTVRLDSGKIKGAKGQILTAASMDAHNTFDKPNTIKPSAYSAKAKGGKLTFKLPAKSIVVVALD